MSKFFAGSATLALLLAATGSADACWCWCKRTYHHPQVVPVAPPIVVDTTGTTDTGTADTGTTDTGTTPPAALTAEEKAWYDYMLKNEYIEASFAENWKAMSGKDRRDFYEKIKKIEKDANEKAEREAKEKEEKEKKDKK